MTLSLIAVSYCERASAGFWAEPLNALSNLAFLAAAVVIVLRCRDRGGCRAQLYLLVALTITITVGSFLWHTLALPWAQWIDVTAIALFILAYLVIYTARNGATQLAWFAVPAWLLLNGLALTLFPAGFLNSSVYYLPTLLVLVGLLVHSRVNRVLLAMTLLFALSLLLRTLDSVLCESYPFGTHFAWHLVNAVVLYLAMRSVAD